MYFVLKDNGGVIEQEQGKRKRKAKGNVKEDIRELLYPFILVFNIFIFLLFKPKSLISLEALSDYI